MYYFMNIKAKNAAKLKDFKSLLYLKSATK